MQDHESLKSVPAYISKRISSNHSSHIFLTIEDPCTDMEESPFSIATPAVEPEVSLKKWEGHWTESQEALFLVLVP